MTTKIDALRALKAAVEAGEFTRCENGPPKYNALANEFLNAGHALPFLNVCIMVKTNTVPAYLSALIAQEEAQ